eukprot:TRINITY_DN938_c0_g1_i1.p1 TRINITY_DN938_c0_g1~~TRINITY_DN938_c0_g1_i1.p1  ORF type:complete len:204 (+),score=64.89 TRINITY_DN938_c0_g1_i1:76-687(+)
MAKAAKMLIVSMMLMAIGHLRQGAFVPPAKRAAPVAAALGVTAAAAAPAFAEDAIDEAARRLSADSYDLIKKIDWNSDIWGKLPSSNPQEVLTALKPILLMGADMSSGSLERGLMAHIKAINSVDANGVTSLGDYEKINAAIGHMIASAPAYRALDVYGSFGTGLFTQEGQDYLVSQYGPEATRAYDAFLKFKDVVKANQVSR